VFTFFFGFETGKPVVYRGRFYITGDRAAKAGKPALQVIEGEREDCGPDCLSSDGMPFIITTPSHEMDDYRGRNRNSLSKQEPMRIVRDLIALDINANKDRSGPPVDILRIDAKGPKWIDKKPGCP
jgi:hypothetical protein